MTKSKVLSPDNTKLFEQHLKGLKKYELEELIRQLRKLHKEVNSDKSDK